MRLRVDLHLFHHFPQGAPGPCAADPQILALLEELKTHMSKTLAAIAALTAAVTAERDLVASAVTTIQGIPTVVSAAVAQALADAGVDDDTAAAAVQAVTDQVTAETGALQAALTANTPAAPPADTGDAGSGSADAAAVEDAPQE